MKKINNNILLQQIKNLSLPSDNDLKCKICFTNNVNVIYISFKHTICSICIIYIIKKSSQKIKSECPFYIKKSNYEPLRLG